MLPGAQKINPGAQMGVDENLKAKTASGSMARASQIMIKEEKFVISKFSFFTEISLSFLILFFDIFFFIS